MHNRFSFKLASYIGGLLGLSLLFLACSSSQNPQVLTKPTELTINPDSLKSYVYALASDRFEGRQTGAEGQREAAQYLADFYQNIKLMPPHGALTYFQNIPSAYLTKQSGLPLQDSENVWAYLPGKTQHDEILILSAHYDHMGIVGDSTFYGADDNASGTATLMEVARLFQEANKQGLVSKRSILFLHFTGEEYGLHGSNFYTENPIVPLSQSFANLNMDMIGRRSPDYKGSEDYVFLIGSDRLSMDLHRVSEAVNAQSVNLDLDYTFNDPNDPQQLYYRSDHYNFAKHNIPIIFYTNGIHEDYHKTTDTPDKIDYPLLRKRAQLIFNTAWELANREAKIKNTES